MKRSTLALCAFALIATTACFLSPVSAQVKLLGGFRLHETVQAGDLRETESLMVRGEPVDVQDGQGRTALMMAAIADNETMIRLLLKYLARADVRDNIGNNAIGYAATHGNVSVVRAMAESKVDLNLANKRGQTPLMLAAAEGHVAVVQYLLERGADAKLSDFTGRSALSWAEHHRKPAVARVLRAAGLVE